MQFVQLAMVSTAVSPAPRVLLIEDEPAIRRAVSRFLTQKGCAVTEAGDGTRALALLADKTFDVVICDINLPGSDGTAVWKSATASRPEMAGRFIFISALPLPEAISRHAPRYLAKPFELAALWNEVQTILQAASREPADP
ncbi:Response regulator receiver protein CpdR [bacterium HR33]|nr:Response regulator receiver protein CpdR [bacterium HR33]